MSTKRAQEWAYFLKRLGLRISKKSIIEYVEISSDYDVWEKFVESNPYALEASRHSHINGPEDLHWLFDQISYASMRSSYPPKANGRSIIGPKIISMQAITKQQIRNRAICNAENSNYLKENMEIKTTDDKDDTLLPLNYIGKRIYHTLFGSGTIVELRPDHCIVVRFDDCTERIFSYRQSIEKGIIKML